MTAKTRLVDAVKAVVDPVTGVITLSTAGTEIPISTLHPAYWCHLYAGDLVPTDDVVFTDKTGNSNHGTRGANLSAGQMWATANYCSALGPLTGALASTLSIPKTNFDYDNGESLLVWWRGKANTPGGTVSLMGDMYTAKGVKIRVDSSGYSDLFIYGAGGGTSGAGGAPAIADGTLHDFAYLLDGENKRLLKWVDGALVVTSLNFASASGDAIATTDWNIGSIALRTNATGIDCSTRSFVLMRWTAGMELPTDGDFTTAIKRLRENPGRMLTVSDL